uniref:Uncharacterized protein n=1 Tax=Chaetoceros debilis TaxID=122233 RepID=A0A7S3V753_9STRA
MFSNTARRLPSFISRRCVQKTQRGSIISKRCLSEAPPKANASEATISSTTGDSSTLDDAQTTTTPRGFPTRHSRHHRPSVAPSDKLDQMSKHILGAMTGTLFGESSYVIIILCEKYFHSFFWASSLPA